MKRNYLMQPSKIVSRPESLSLSSVFKRSQAVDKKVVSIDGYSKKGSNKKSTKPSKKQPSPNKKPAALRKQVTSLGKEMVELRNVSIY